MLMLIAVMMIGQAEPSTVVQLDPRYIPKPGDVCIVESYTEDHRDADGLGRFENAPPERRYRKILSGTIAYTSQDLANQFYWGDDATSKKVKKDGHVMLVTANARVKIIRSVPRDVRYESIQQFEKFKYNYDPNCDFFEIKVLDGRHKGKTLVVHCGDCVRLLHPKPHPTF